MNLTTLRRIYRSAMAVSICALIPWGYVVETGQRQADEKHPHAIHAKSRPRYVTAENKSVHDVAGVILVLAIALMIGSRVAIYRAEKKARQDGSPT